MRRLGRVMLCGVLLFPVGACQKSSEGSGGGKEKGAAATGGMDGKGGMDGMEGMGNKGAGDAMGRVAPRPGSSKGAGALDDAAARKQTDALFAAFSGKAYGKVAALLAPKTREALPEPKVKALWEQLLGQLGEYRAHAVVKTSTLKEYRRHQVRVTFEKGTILLYVVWTPERQVTGLFVRPDLPEFPPWQPPPYAKADQVREIPFTVGEGELALPGVLTVPTARGGTRYPAVVLVHGSGPQDRDETLGPNKPFKDLAWGLAAQGIAVLRYDKVTKAHPAKAVKMLTQGFTMDSETTNDALKAVAQLRAHTLVQPERVFYLGHSQGAIAAPRAGKRDPKLAGIILMGGPTRPFAEIGLDQLTYIASLGGPQGAATKQVLEKYREQLKVVNSPALTADTPAEKLPFGIPASFWIDLKRYDIKAVARALAMPILVLQGEADYQVTMTDFAGWKKALAGKKNAVLKSYPRLGHHFIDLAKAKAVPEDYYKVTGHVAKDVIDDVAKFVRTAK